MKHKQGTEIYHRGKQQAAVYDRPHTIKWWMGCIAEANNARCDNEVNYMLPLCQATSGNRCLQPRGTKRSPMVLQIVPKRILPRLSACSLWQQPARSASPASGEQVDPVSPGGGLTCHTYTSWPPHANTNTSRSANCRSCEIWGVGGGCAVDILMITQHILTYINAIWIC